MRQHEEDVKLDNIKYRHKCTMITIRSMGIKHELLSELIDQQPGPNEIDIIKHDDEQQRKDALALLRTNTNERDSYDKTQQSTMAYSEIASASTAFALHDFEQQNNVTYSANDIPSTALAEDGLEQQRTIGSMNIDKYMIINFYEHMLRLLSDMHNGIDLTVDMAELELLNDKAQRLAHVSSSPFPLHPWTYHQDRSDEEDDTNNLQQRQQRHLLKQSTARLLLVNALGPPPQPNQDPQCRGPSHQNPGG